MRMRLLKRAFLLGGLLPFVTTAAVHAQDTVTISVQVSSGNDDAEESVASGGINFTSSDLELNNEGGGNPQVIGMRFLGIAIPAGAVIESAQLVFTVDETDIGPASVRVFAELTGDAPPIVGTAFNLSSRVRTANSVEWNDIPPWTTAGEFGPDQTTPDIAAIIQEIINLPSWSEGNAMLLLIKGNPDGERTAEAFDGASQSAAELIITFFPEAPPETITIRVADGNDDAEEHITEGNTMDIGSSEPGTGCRRRRRRSSAHRHPIRQCRYSARLRDSECFGSV